MSGVEIRTGRAGDLAALTAIYNHYVRETPVTFDIEPLRVEQRAPWLASFGETGRHRIFVAEEAGRVLGWASSGAFRAKAAYATTVETTVYLDESAHGRGVGTRLYGALFASLADTDVHRLVAGVTLPNDASIALHRRFGFEDVGVFRAVGRKFDRYWDVLWMERAAAS